MVFETPSAQISIENDIPNSLAAATPIGPYKVRLTANSQLKNMAAERFICALLAPKNFTGLDFSQVLQ
ncbi:hypothetical protein [Aliiroseovarius crassostreae]|uniref:hypothetical protein n=1 Tax=Aliiroseovarius crassostreae TaxID=154981 RepID=UPI0011143F11|nr:hypothetical protein [Aliiroseovarius crassostreae]